MALSLNFRKILTAFCLIIEKTFLPSKQFCQLYVTTLLCCQVTCNYVITFPLIYTFSLFGNWGCRLFCKCNIYSLQMLNSPWLLLSDLPLNNVQYILNNDRSGQHAGQSDTLTLCSLKSQRLYISGTFTHMQMTWIIIFNTDACTYCHRW